MARKSSELVKALEQQSAYVQPDYERISAEATQRAIKSLAEKGLARAPGESLEAWRRRTLTWMKEQNSRWKKLGEDGIEDEIPVGNCGKEIGA